MGIKLPLTKKKGGDKVADNPPPVFTKHASGEDLLKGHRNDLKGSSNHERHSSSPHKPSSHRSKSLEPPTNHTDNGSSGHTASSTALWVAASNAAANRSKKFNKQQSEGSVSSGGPGMPPRKQSSEMSARSFDDEEVSEDEFFEEEVVEESDFEEEIVEELAPRVITIKFDEFDEMQTILHINDYTKHEISRSWYKRDDYDKMVALARKTAEKVEERSKELGRKIDKATKKKIEYRGLEAWTSMGAAKVRILKESAVEAVWNEQSRQWDEGINDVDRIREVYQIISRGAQQTAQDRGFSDELISKRIRQLELEEAEKKKNRKLLGKSKALLGKSVKVTAGGVVKTAKLGVKTTKLTGKVALATTKAATKTAVATATLDRKMLKEAILPAKKKRECEKQLIRKPSQARIGGEAKEGHEVDEAHSDSEREEDDKSVNTEKAKKKKNLKLLGVVPIPGTHKTYREDRRQERIEKRIGKQKTRPSWEAHVSAGKY
eukprot:Nitzschia sp. Nitz4//NODE_293_length_29386_cov_71.949235//15197//16769//NITZ4_additional_000036-RA//-1//CDS//3329531830//6472//frame0